MNSLMQQLFMQPDFRYDLLALPVWLGSPLPPSSASLWLSLFFHLVIPSCLWSDSHNKAVLDPSRFNPFCLFSPVGSFSLLFLCRKRLLFTQEKEHKDESVLYQMQSLFINLQESNYKSYNALQFCNSFEVEKGKTMKTDEQMDVDEFFNTLFDR